MTIPAKLVFTLIGSTLLTYSLIALSRRYKISVRPSAARWHKEATPFLGGVAIYLSFVLSSLFFAAGQQYLNVFLASSTAMFLLGLSDDFLKFGWKIKLLSQIVAVFIFAIAAIDSGSQLGLVMIFVASSLLLTNSFNLLDNIDSLAGAYAMIAFTSFVSIFYLTAVEEGLILFPLISLLSVLGFWIFNLSPAKIFMGDSGSLFIGFQLSVFGFFLITASGLSLASSLLVFALIVFLPFFDTLFVSVMRLYRGRKITDGGRDHLSHRLVRAGLMEEKAVGLLLVIASISNLFALIALVSQIWIGAFLLVTMLLSALLLVMKLKLYQEN